MINLQRFLILKSKVDIGRCSDMTKWPAPAIRIKITEPPCRPSTILAAIARWNQEDGPHFSAVVKTLADVAGDTGSAVLVRRSETAG